jgi:2-C-methyl-D-erythritol 4-phosphate cytidylyltransferase
LSQARALLGARFGKLRRVIAGGSDRPGSTRRAIDLLSSAGWTAGWAAGAGPDCHVLFHDAARPLLDQRVISDCVRALEQCEALGVAIPTADTIVEVTDGLMTAIPDREVLARCQTPQGFRLSVIRRAYELADADLRSGRFVATDDCGVVLRYLPEIAIRIVPGSDRNIKVTYPADVAIAETLLALRATPARSG